MIPNPTNGTIRNRALTLVDVLVVSVVATLSISLALPAFSNTKEQARRQQCAVNQKKIIKAYARWAQDHGGFWPPRCAPADGCTQVNNVWILVEGGPTGMKEKQQGTAYYAGDPDARNRWPAIVGEPALEDDVEDYPLNPYLVPGWQFGDKIDTLHCPSDADNLVATELMEGPDLQARGFEEGDVASNYQFHGSSYFYNQVSAFPWRGYGDWAGSIVLHDNKMEGPNFNPDLIHRPGAFVAGLDMGTMYAAWKVFITNLVGPELGNPVPGAKWHEARLAGPGQWLDANAFHADGHVTFARRENLGIVGYIIPFPSAQCFITAEWSLFPLKLDKSLLTPKLLLNACRPGSP